MPLASTMMPTDPTQQAKRRDIVVPSLPPDASCVASIDCEWSVAKIHTQHAKAVASRMLAAGFNYYLPLVNRTKRKANRATVVISTPFLPGFLFAEAAAADFLRKQYRAFAGFVPVYNQKRLVRDLSNIEILLHARPEYGSHPIAEAYRAAPSGRMRVQVIDGPFEGVIGEVMGVNEGKYKVSVGVTMLNTFTMLEIDEAKLTILD